ncbi:MAG: iron-containing alcohol dehydrogenase [Bosea sp.]|nr:iron-containing alcohol dehydrogenase [Bosea sp. (in: a-proteobacteria)]MCP4736921.1 iron-containing alcohol dehydrogenase [Bosea sp. (in: a-proteobacteria)]MDX3805036.1 iron-containing alcohol dehydrogenase [Bosea sp. (in: a-proteobacteria)]
MHAIALPRIMRIGAGALDDLPQALAQLGLGRPAVVTDRFIAHSGALARLKAGLGNAGIEVRVFADAVPDPTVASVVAATAFIGEGGHDCVIGLGGGSPIDTAKAAAVLSLRGGEMASLKAPHQEDAPGLPIVAIPTTAGTGSEATRFTIVTDERTDEKMLCAGLAYLPSIAIVDYELTLTKPYRLIADTGIDALTHAIEAYVSRRANPFTDALALSAAKTIWNNLPTACNEPGNRAAREAMMLAATQAGIAFSNASVALVHGMSRPIGAHFHVAHGLSNAMLLPAVSEWSAAGAPARYAAISGALGLAGDGDDDEVAASRLTAALRQLNHDLQVPTPQAYGIDERKWKDVLPLMAEQALASGSPANNPRVPDAMTIQDLYRRAWA